MAMGLGKCPGHYCGRTILNDSLSDCGVCPRGFRVNDSSEQSLCYKCDENPTLYDWMYLGFMAILTLVLHWFFIDIVCMRKSFKKQGLILHLSAFFEVLLAGLATLLSSHPMGEFKIRGCRVQALSDWYTLFYNPQPQYEYTLYCTQEAVYPLNSMVLMFLGLCLLIMLSVRPWLCSKLLPKQSKMAVYAAMYYIPILAFAQVTVGGLIYYSFPYVLIVMSALSSATHFAVKIEQTPLALLKSIVSLRDAVILLGHWALLAYGIVSLVQSFRLQVLLVPAPTIFYILTAHFTDPNKLNID